MEQTYLGWNVYARCEDENIVVLFNDMDEIALSPPAVENLINYIDALNADRRRKEDDLLRRP